MSQQLCLLEIEQHIAIVEDVKHDLTRRLDSTDNKIHIRFLREKIKGLNTELRILNNIRASLNRTIRSKHRPDRSSI